MPNPTLRRSAAGRQCAGRFTRAWPRHSPSEIPEMSQSTIQPSNPGVLATSPYLPETTANTGKPDGSGCIHLGACSCSSSPQKGGGNGTKGGNSSQRDQPSRPRACPQLGEESAQYWNRGAGRGESILRCCRRGVFFGGLKYPRDVGHDSWRSAAGELTDAPLRRSRRPMGSDQGTRPVRAALSAWWRSAQ